ncbi:helix-turn-helix transcriptional regulator [uncultured Hyphomicrobium sp.]|jgi:transcriptional regulator with XRE-family HTH domain|uniref:helix-turn-helix transcriptional regulator n=1 Tax=uncultured Hyphomicrobium sp. TaxID=194373 RepID=UPI0025D6841B|nr:helix-turn-helix transcriptional regulator [uncultured Hyphomicrobium sp.]
MRPRAYSSVTKEALRLLGQEVRLARKERRMSEADLAARVGIARSTVQLIEKGDPKVEIGLVFEAATITGVNLFGADLATLRGQQERVADKLALLPQSVRRPKRAEVSDDF